MVQMVLDKADLSCGRDITADMLDYMFGLIRWTIDLISFLTDELLEISHLLRGRFDDVELINETGGFPNLITLARSACSSLSPCSLPLASSPFPAKRR